MSKPFPEKIVLKHHKCPTCGTEFGHPPLKRIENQVQATCHKEGCDFNLELFWIGDLDEAWAN